MKPAPHLSFLVPRRFLQPRWMPSRSGLRIRKHNTEANFLPFFFGFHNQLHTSKAVRHHFRLGLLLTAKRRGCMSLRLPPFCFEEPSCHAAATLISIPWMSEHRLLGFLKNSGGSSKTSTSCGIPFPTKSLLSGYGTSLSLRKRR